MDEDLLNLNLDKPGRGKSAEQLKKHTVDEAYESKPIERSVFLLTHGDDVQKLNVVQALPQLILKEPQQTYSRILPKILQELPNSSCEFHVITSKVFRVLMEKQLPCNLLHAVLQGIESRDLIVSNSWMETLLAVIGVLTLQQVKTEIIPLVNAKSVITQPVNSRVASSKIVGKIALHPKIDATDVKRDLLPLTQGLCQDCHAEVRMNICKQLPNVAKGLGDNFSSSSLMVSLVELGSDDSSNVASSAISSMVNILPLASDDVKKLTIIPLIKQVFDRCLKSDDVIASTVATEIGKLLTGLQKIINPHEASWFLGIYKSLARRGLTSTPGRHRQLDTSMDVLCRQQCAANLPLMLAFIQKKLPAEMDSIQDIIKDLSQDPCYIVRRTIAMNFHDIIKLFENRNLLLKRDLIRLLRDDSEEVLQMLIPKLGETLMLLAPSLTSQGHPKEDNNVLVGEVGKAMIKCLYELVNSCNWRLMTQFLTQMEKLPHCIPHEYIHQNFTPILLNIAVQGRAKPVRTQAARTLLMFLRFNGRDMQRRWLRENLVSQLCYSPNCYTRSIFIRMCVHSLDIFSEKYFKEHFYDNLLDLADDPVSNIRLCVASLFCVLREMLVLPVDQLLNERLQEIFTKFTQEEKNKDVLSVFNKQIKEIKKRNLVTVNKAEREKEQKRRVDEEDKITLSGVSKVMAPAGTPKRKSINRPGATTGTRTSSSYREASSVNAAYVKPTTSRDAPQQSDLSFLEQHFYIDAGVALPVGGAQKIGKNITDDEKVNMRKFVESDKKTKRYSSVISSDCLLEKENKAANRRSLNLRCGDTSRIPISVKKGGETGEKSVKDSASSQTPPRPSSLPILRRRHN